MRTLQSFTSGLLFTLFGLVTIEAFAPVVSVPSPVHYGGLSPSGPSPPPFSFSSSSSSSSTALYASRRRETFSWLRRIFVAGVLGGASTQRPRDALAAVEVGESSSSSQASSATADGGSVIVFTVENLDGIEGNKGTVKIQMEPTWAPRGVQRLKN
jgi:hypothetical protein